MRVLIPEMWGAVARHDVREMHRGGRMSTVGALLAVLMVLAFAAGASWTAFQQDAIGRLLEARDAQDAAYRHDAIAYFERHGAVGQGAPQHPVSVYWKRAYAWMPPHPASLLATGQTDLRPYYAVFHGVSEQVLHYASELRNPVHLLIGIPDPAVVVTYLLPLLVIALLYDVVSGDRDSGRMPLLEVQAGRVTGIMMVRLGVRAGGLAAALTAGLVLGLAVTSPAALTSAASWQFLLLSLSYLACWSGAALLVNTWRLPAWLCGLTLLSAWALSVFLVPTALHGVAEHRHPVPSRARHMLAAADVRQAVDADRPRYLAELLESRPDLAVPGDPARRPTGGPEWYSQFLAYQMALETAAATDERRFTEALAAQEQFARRWRLVSPAIVMHQGAQRVAGTSVTDMLRFREDVSLFRARWLEVTRGFIFRNEYLTPADFDRLPRFEPAPHRAPWRRTLADAGGLTAFALVFVAVAARRISRG